MENISIVTDKQIQNNIPGYISSAFYMCDNRLYTYDYGEAKYIFVEKYSDYLLRKIDISTIHINMRDTVHNQHDLIVDKDMKMFFYKTDSLYDDFLETLISGGTCMLFSHIFINYSLKDHRLIPLPYKVEKMMNNSNGYQTLYAFEYEEEYPLPLSVRDLLMFEKNFV